MINEAEQRSDLHKLRIKLNEGVICESFTEKIKEKYKYELKRRKIKNNSWKNKIYEDIKGNRGTEFR